MTFATEITDRAAALVAVLGVDVESQDVAARATLMSDADAVTLAEAAAALMRDREAFDAGCRALRTRAVARASHGRVARARTHGYGQNGCCAHGARGRISA
jgi:hypothetical protein